MSYRPTVSIYLNGEIAEIYLFRDAEPDHLRDFAFALAVFLDGCESKEQVREMLKMPPAEESFLKELEAGSEDPFLIDLTSRCIYCNYQPIRKEDLIRTSGGPPLCLKAGSSAFPPCISRLKPCR